MQLQKTVIAFCSYTFSSGFIFVLFFFLFSPSPMPTKYHGILVVPIEECSFAQINEIEGVISNKDINETYIASVTSSLDCLWMIEVKPGWQVRIYTINSIVIQTQEILFLLCDGRSTLYCDCLKNIASIQ